MIGQRRAGGLGVVHRVQKERTARLEPLQHVVLVHVRRHVARHEVGRRNQIGRRDGAVAETKVRRGVAARLLRVVGEVSLTILVGRTADDLDRVLVGTHRTVGAEAEEERLERAGFGERDLLADGQRAERYVVRDAHRKPILRFVGLQVAEHREHLRRRGVFRREAVAAADDERLAIGGDVLAGSEGLHHVEVEGVAVGSGFFRAVQHADALHALGNHLAEILHRERTVEMHRYHADLLALCIQVIDRLLERLGYGAHGHDDPLGIGGAVVGERLVGAAGDLRNAFHGIGHHVGHGVVELVGRLAGLEVDVGVLGRAARYGMLGIERPGTELPKCLAVEHGRERRLVDQLDLLDLVRGAEAVEEVQERHARPERNDVGDTGQIHHFLHRRGGEHGEARLAGRHHILMVAEDRERLRRQRTGRNMEHAGEQLARNFVHIGNHQQETLRCREGRSQRPALQRSVHGTGCTGLGLHLNDFHGLAEDVFAALGRPFVHEFRHSRRRRDGVDRRDLREHVRHMSRRVVTITSDEFLFCHNLAKKVNICMLYSNLHSLYGPNARQRY